MRARSRTYRAMRSTDGSLHACIEQELGPGDPIDRELVVGREQRARLLHLRDLGVSGIARPVGESAVGRGPIGTLVAARGMLGIVRGQVPGAHPVVRAVARVVGARSC